VYFGGRDQEDYGCKPAQANSSWEPILKKTQYTQKKVGRVAQVVEHLPSMCEALSSNSSTTKKPPNKQKTSSTSIAARQDRSV
jgi:hypothetical protein